MQLTHSIQEKSSYIGNYLDKACNLLKIVCNSQKNVFLCYFLIVIFLCVTHIHISSSIQDLAGTGLTEPLQPQEGQPQVAALEDAGENLLLIEEPTPGSVVPVAPHAAPPPPTQEHVITPSMASELTSKNK